MTELGKVWAFTRYRLEMSLGDLTDEQIQATPYPGGHSIAEIVAHVAGAEHYWSARLLGTDPNATELDAKLDLAIHDGFLREGNSPFTLEELTKAKLLELLEYSGNQVRPLYEDPTEEQLTTRMRSPIGDDVSGEEGLIRLAQHAGYHTGQIWMIRMMHGWE